MKSNYTNNLNRGFAIVHLLRDSHTPHHHMCIPTLLLLPQNLMCQILEVSVVQDRHALPVHPYLVGLGLGRYAVLMHSLERLVPKFKYDVLPDVLEDRLSVLMLDVFRLFPTKTHSWVNTNNKVGKSRMGTITLHFTRTSTANTSSWPCLGQRGPCCTGIRRPRRQSLLRKSQTVRFTICRLGTTR